MYSRGTDSLKGAPTACHLAVKGNIRQTDQAGELVQLLTARSQTVGR